MRRTYSKEARAESQEEENSFCRQVDVENTEKCTELQYEHEMPRLKNKTKNTTLLFV